MSKERRTSEAACRNQGPIADGIADWLPAEGTVLEIASGSGQHVHLFAQRYPHLTWQPTEKNAQLFPSISAWTNDQPNAASPVLVDVETEDWERSIQADGIVSINMIHIAPWEATLGLFRGAQVLLGKGRRVILYGPFFLSEQQNAPSNHAFDERLRQQDSRWGVRLLDDVVSVAGAQGFSLRGTVGMPANNLLVVFERN